MTFKQQSLQTATVLALCVSSGVYAGSWQCSHADLVRDIAIEYPDGGAVPCNVIYSKAMEGYDDQVLWSAMNEEGYCEKKALELVVKLETSGWICVQRGPADIIANTEAEQPGIPDSEQPAEVESVQAGNLKPQRNPESELELISGSEEPAVDKIQ